MIEGPLAHSARRSVGFLRKDSGRTSGVERLATEAAKQRRYWTGEREQLVGEVRAAR